MSKPKSDWVFRGGMEEKSAYHHSPYLQFCLQQIKLTSSSNKELAKAYNVIHFCSNDVLTGSLQCGRLPTYVSDTP